MKVAILPIKKKYIDLIFSGEKTIEVRKQKIRQNIDRVYMYETRPTSRIVGYFDIEYVYVTLKDGWICRKACLTPEELDDYLGDNKFPITIGIKPSTATRCEDPFGLNFAPQGVVYKELI